MIEKGLRIHMATDIAYEILEQHVYEYSVRNIRVCCSERNIKAALQTKYWHDQENNIFKNKSGH